MPASASFFFKRSIASSSDDLSGLSVIANPHGGTDGDREVREEIPADVAAGDVPTQLGVVAERKAYDARAIAVIRNPRRAIGDGEQRVEAERELAKRPSGSSRSSGAVHLGFDRCLARSC